MQCAKILLPTMDHPRRPSCAVNLRSHRHSWLRQMLVGDRRISACEIRPPGAAAAVCDSSLEPAPSSRMRTDWRKWDGKWCHALQFPPYIVLTAPPAIGFATLLTGTVPVSALLSVPV